MSFALLDTPMCANAQAAKNAAKVVKVIGKKVKKGPKKKTSKPIQTVQTSCFKL